MSRLVLNIEPCVGLAARELNAHAAAEGEPDVQAVARIVLPTRPNPPTCRMSHEFVRWELKYVWRLVRTGSGVERVFTCCDACRRGRLKHPPQALAECAGNAAAAKTTGTGDTILIVLNGTVVTEPTF